MKIRSILASCLAMLMLASCSKEGNDVPVDPADVAYVSINVVKQNVTRAGSTENTGLNESDLKELYLVTFDNSDNVVGIPGTTNYFAKALLLSSPNENKPAAVKIAGAATKLLVIANPGSQLLAALQGIGASSDYVQVNAAITRATAMDAISEISDDVSNISKGFAMISSGEEGFNAGDVINSPLIDITGYVEKTVDHNYDDDAAMAAAEAKRVTVRIERIASKLELKAKSVIEVPTGAEFAFGNWTLDALNTTFYPFAKKDHARWYTHGKLLQFKFLHGGPELQQCHRTEIHNSKYYDIRSRPYYELDERR